MIRPFFAALVPVLLSALLSACASDLSEVGKSPSLSPVGSGLDPTTSGSLYRYPKAETSPRRPFSTWDDRQSKLFTDQRALSPGDILTVLIEIDDRARFKNESDRSRTAKRTLGLNADASWESAKTGGGLTGSADSNTQTDGSGKIERSETLRLSVAAVVVEVLPNGNLVIKGRQEVRVNAELRELTIAGIVRPSDIGGNNTIQYDRIAEARISYGGRGRLTEVQQPAYGQQILDQVLPF